MLARQRQQLILQEISRNGAVRVSELTERYNVSDMTIRRDLDALERDGLVTKVHGGATLPVGRSAEEISFTEKLRQRQEEKQSIGVAAATLIAPGMSVCISGGTTTWAAANYLREIENLTIITNSTSVADVLCENPVVRQTVLLTGGERTPSHTLVGPVADKMLASYRADVCLIGAHGISPDHGLTTPNVAEARTNEVMIESSSQLIVLCDSSKWGMVGLVRFATLEDLDVLVTDHCTPSMYEALEGKVRRIVVSEAPEGAHGLVRVMQGEDARVAPDSRWSRYHAPARPPASEVDAGTGPAASPIKR
ncbi:DeoR/GlpR transcriptional regulator [Micrococcales bacterium 31B]|nr:DeoR/GlpR transcriptional regulator [Micrococcales bacterium 31B]